MTIARTLENPRYHRPGNTIGSTATQQWTCAVSGTSPQNGGVAFILGAVPLLQDPANESEAVMVAYESDLGYRLDPIELRVDHLFAVEREAENILGYTLPIIARAERRLALPSEGVSTENWPWYFEEQPGWKTSIRRDPLCKYCTMLVEIRASRLETYVYRHADGERRLGNIRAFLRQLEAGEIEADYLTMSDDGDAIIGVPEDSVLLAGEVIDDEGDAFPLIAVFGGVTTTLYLVVTPFDADSDRVDRDRIDREGLRQALPGLHGSSATGTSEDQGMGLRVPWAALPLTSSTWNRLSNFEALRSASHGKTQARHWLIP